MFNISSSVRLRTTGFIRLVHSPFRAPCRMSYICRRGSWANGRRSRNGTQALQFDSVAYAALNVFPRSVGHQRFAFVDAAHGRIGNEPGAGIRAAPRSLQHSRALR